MPGLLARFFLGFIDAFPCCLHHSSVEEEADLAQTLDGLRAALGAAACLDASILVVDNGSTDATAAIAQLHGAAVVSEPHRGYGRACLTGIAAPPA